VTAPGKAGAISWCKFVPPYWRRYFVAVQESPCGKRTFYACGRMSVLGGKAVMQQTSPQIAREFDRDGGCAVLHQCIRPLIGAFCAPGHHGYQRACELVSGQASMGHWVHQGSHAPGRPILHLVSGSLADLGG